MSEVIRWLQRISATLTVVLAAGCSDFPPSVRDWFFTPDQQGQRLFDRGEFRAAAEKFLDPLRQGTAWYRAGEFDKAAAAFGQSETAEGWFNRGDALVMQGKYEAAIASYDRALTLRPGWKVAQENRDLAVARRDRIANASVHQEEAIHQKPDQIIVGRRKSPAGTEETEPEGSVDLTDPAMRAIWLRRVQTSPQDFLRAKFAAQSALANQAGTGP